MARKKVYAPLEGAAKDTAKDTAKDAAKDAAAMSPTGRVYDPVSRITEESLYQGLDPADVLDHLPRARAPVRIVPDLDDELYEAYKNNRQDFNNTVRRNFLKWISTDPFDPEAIARANNEFNDGTLPDMTPEMALKLYCALRANGLNNRQIGILKRGQCPDTTKGQYETHHLVPLSYMGTNAMINLTLVREDYHDAFHRDLRPQAEALTKLDKDGRRMGVIDVPITEGPIFIPKHRLDHYYTAMKEQAPKLEKRLGRPLDWSTAQPLHEVTDNWLVKGNNDADRTVKLVPLDPVRAAAGDVQGWLKHLKPGGGR